MAKAGGAGGPKPSIVHPGFFSGRALGLPKRTFWYNPLLSQEHDVPVGSVIVLLRPEAEGREGVKHMILDIHAMKETWVCQDILVREEMPKADWAIARTVGSVADWLGR